MVRTGQTTRPAYFFYRTAGDAWRAPMYGGGVESTDVSGHEVCNCVIYSYIVVKGIYSACLDLYGII